MRQTSVGLSCVAADSTRRHDELGEAAPLGEFVTATTAIDPCVERYRGLGSRVTTRSRRRTIEMLVSPSPSNPSRLLPL